MTRDLDDGQQRQPPPGRERVAATYGQRTVDAIEDFLDHAAMAARLVDQGERALHDETARLAVEAVTIRLGESVRRMGDAFVSDHADLGLIEIRDTRNLVAHQYHVVAHHLLWNAFEKRLPETVTGLRAILPPDG